VVEVEALTRAGLDGGVVGAPDATVVALEAVAAA